MSQELQKTSERFPNEEAPECERGIIVTADEMDGTLEVVEPSMVVEAVDNLSAGRSRSKVHPMVPVWVSFVVNLIPIQSEGFLGIQKLSKRVA